MCLFVCVCGGGVCVWGGGGGGVQVLSFSGVTLNS